MSRDIAKASAAIIAIASMLFFSGCAPAKGTPTLTPQVTVVAVESAPAAVVEPAPASQVRKARIAVPTIWGEGYFDAIEKRVNAALAKAGQDVELVVQTAPNNMGNANFLKQVKEELTAGTPSADAYTLFFADSLTLFNEGYTTDLTDWATQYAPAYAAKYASLLPVKLSGIPVGIRSHPLPYQLALMLREDYAESGKGIRTIDSLFRFIDETIVLPGNQQVVQAYENSLVLQWALEQGYYDLSKFGVGGYLLCNVNDADFTPVPLESIPGFAEFLTMMKQHWQNGSIGYTFDDNDGRECIAYVFAPSDFYQSSVYVSVPFAPGKFIAQPFSPEMPAYYLQPFYSYEIAVPGTCPQDQVASVLRFVEWMYGAQDNYDSVIYGEKGTDFVDVDGRYSPLKDGQAPQGKDFDLTDGLFFSWPGADILFNFDFFRLPSSAPDNVPKLVDDVMKQNLRFPFSTNLGVNNKTASDALFRMSEEMEVLSRQRMQMLDQLIQGDPQSFNEVVLSSSLDRVTKLNNKGLVEHARALIDKMAHGKQ